MLDILIKNGQIVNGKNEAPYLADVAIQDDTIVEIGKIESAAKMVIDAKGKLITPGFIDMHCHSDGIIFDERKNPKRLRQGFTTEVIGNCGISAAPVNPETVELLDTYSKPIFSKYPTPFTWTTFAEYMQALEEQKPMLNTVCFAGHGTLRIAVVGFEARKLTAAEMDKMKELLTECMEAGAFGMSSGLIYAPGVFAGDEELFELAKVVKKYEGMYSSHMRSESSGLLESVKETIRVASETGVNTEISHHKAAGRQNYGKTKKTLAMIEKANHDGFNVNCDVYPYEASNTSLNSILPPWALAGGVSKLLERLSDNDLRAKMISEIKDENSSFENAYQLSGWDKIFINDCPIHEYIGKSVKQIAEEKNQDQFEVALDIIKDCQNDVTMNNFFMSEEDISRVIYSPYSMICTDGVPTLGKYHPRYIGSFIRVLEKYVKEEHLLSLPQAIHKMTGKTSAKLGIKDRGIIEVQMKADLLVIDFEKLHDNSNFLDHDALADGIDYVIINGKVAVENGIFNSIQAGKVLYRS